MDKTAAAYTDLNKLPLKTRLLLQGDSAEAVQPDELHGHRPCLSPERAKLATHVGASGRNFH
jgi:hypothetical protein